MASEKVAASEALRQLQQKLKTKPVNSTPLSLPLAMSSDTNPSANHNGNGNCTCRPNSAFTSVATNGSRPHSMNAHFDAPPPPSPSSGHLHSLALNTVGIPPGPTSTRTLEQVREQMASIEEGLNIGSDLKKISEEGYSKQFAAARKMRDLICTNRDDLIKELIDRKLIPKLMRWLHPRQKLEVQVEALWALTNFIAGASEYAAPLIKHGAVSALTQLLTCSNQNVSKQVVWLLGSLAAGGAGARDAVVQGGVLVPLVNCLERYQVSRDLIKVCAWALSKVCDGQTQGQQEVAKAMPILTGLLQHPGTDAETLSHACWAVSHLCDGPGAHVKAVVEAGAVWRLVELVQHSSWRVIKPALRTIGNIVCAEDDVDYTQHVIDVGAVVCLRQLIKHQHKEIQKEACWTLSNIAAGTVEQIQTVLDNDCMQYVISLTHSQKDQEVKTEACWVVLNATSCGSDSQIEYLVELGCISVLANLLMESSMAAMALDGLERILQVGDRLNRHERALIAALAMKARDEEQPNDEKTSVLLERHLFGNPFAHLEIVEKLEVLEGSSNSLGKRAASIRKQYYVTCAICTRIFSRGSGETHFCNECQCDVCLSCDCMRFHLSFLQEEWGKLEDEERLAQEQRLKKSRRKRRTKDKKVKEDTNFSNERKPPAGSTTLQSRNTASEPTYTQSNEDQPSPWTSLPSDPKADGSLSGHNAYSPKGSVNEPATEPKSTSHQSTKSKGKKCEPTKLDDLSKRAPATGTDSTKEKYNTTSGADSSDKLTSEDSSPMDSPLLEVRVTDAIEENDRFVSFLQETGSILALARKMDEHDRQLELENEQRNARVNSKGERERRPRGGATGGQKKKASSQRYDRAAGGRERAT